MTIMQLYGFWERLVRFADIAWTILDTSIADHLAQILYNWKDTSVLSGFYWLFAKQAMESGFTMHWTGISAFFVQNNSWMGFSLLEFILGAGFVTFIGVKLFIFLWDLLPIV